jgi:antitoxin PrlF
MAVSVLTSKGQTTIPKKVRDYLKLHPGDRVDFAINKEGKVILEPATLDVKELEGILHRKGMKAVSSEQMKEAVKARFKGK